MIYHLTKSQMMMKSLKKMIMMMKTKKIIFHHNCPNHLVIAVWRQILAKS
jgi:hypothetical protein